MEVPTQKMFTFMRNYKLTPPPHFPDHKLRKILICLGEYGIKAYTERSYNVLRDYKHLKQENQRTYLNGIVHSHRKTEKVLF